MHTRRSRDKDLLFDSEIERTARLNRKASATRTLLDPSPSFHSDTDIEEEQEPFVNAMADEAKPLKSSFVPQGVAQPSCITFTPADGTSFSLSPQLINSVPHFYGKPNEDPNSHLESSMTFVELNFHRV